MSEVQPSKALSPMHLTGLLFIEPGISRCPEAALSQVKMVIEEFSSLNENGYFEGCMEAMGVFLSSVNEWCRSFFSRCVAKAGE